MRQVLGDTLRGISVDENSIADVLLAATEACSNVVLHAGPSVRAYTVGLTVDGTACRVEVTDVGRGLRALPERPSRPARPARIDALPESGRGIAIMRACMDEVTLRSAPGAGTRVVLAKRIRWAQELARSA